MKMNKTLFLLCMMFLLGLVSAVALVTPTLVSPVGGAWEKDSAMNFTFSCGGNTTSPVGYDATLYHNASGTWKSNFTVENLSADAKQNFTTAEALPDSTLIYWNVQCENNLTGETNFASNVSFKYDNTVPTIPSINVPANNSFQGALKPYVNWTASTEANFLKYVIDLASDKAFTNIIYQNVITDEDTLEKTLTSEIERDVQYFLRVLVHDEAGNTNFQYHNVTFLGTAPSISISSFSDETYLSDSTPAFAITATHQFVSQCDLYINSTGSWGLNTTDLSGNGSLTLTPSAIADGVYEFGFNCNNSGGNASGFTANRTLIVDTTDPSGSRCTGVYGENNSKSIDHTPNFDWTSVTEANFGNYTVYVDNNSDFSSPEIQLNISDEDTLSGTPDLRPYDSVDRTWYWNMTVTDLAGNVFQATNCTHQQYRTDVTNHLLKDGWNIVSIMQSGTVNASDLGKGLGVSWTTISRFNESKAFNDYNNGSATNGGMLFKKGDVVFINVNVDTYWENQTWDTSVDYAGGGQLNLSNVTNDWSLMGIQNQSGWSLGHIERLFYENNDQSGGEYGFVSVAHPVNESLSVIVGVNNSASVGSRYISHPSNYSFNNATTMDFGEVVWINLNATHNISSHGGVGVFTLNLSQRVT